MRRAVWLTIWALALPACGVPGGRTPGDDDSFNPPAETSPLRPTTTSGGDAPAATLPAPSLSLPKEPPVKPTIVPAEPGVLDITGIEQLTALATADLARRLEAPPEDITVVSAVLAAWPDTSYGCPTPGRVYAQIASEGSIILLDHGGDVYRYHSGGEDLRPFLCSPAPE